MLLRELPVLKMEFLLTRQCQLRCGYCKISRGHGLRGEEMGTERALKCVEMMAEYWPGAPIIFFGGEPTLRDDLPDIIQRCTDLGVKHAVISNSLRVFTDPEYVSRLVNAGLSNWSVSFDGFLPEAVSDKDAFEKSTKGLRALKMFRDEYGIRDLVTCITVTRKNVSLLEGTIKRLTEEGVWSICTPLQYGGEGYDYSKGRMGDAATPSQIREVKDALSMMARSGQFLMHNGPEWFQLWDSTEFLSQAWRCHDKSNLTVDADGCLRYCVDIALRTDIRMWDLEDPNWLGTYMECLKSDTRCKGCSWDPAYESISRAINMGVEDGRSTFRHELSDERIKSLYNGAGKWFVGNPTLQRIK